MKTIGILNLQEVNNYGCVLGAYGILEVLRKLAPDAETELIDFHPLKRDRTFGSMITGLIESVRYYGLQYTYRKYAGRLAGGKGNKPQMAASVISMDARVKCFSDFRDQYLRRSTVYESLTEENAPRYDIYIVGSDVVWLLSELFGNGRYPDFLAFTDGMDCRRISYAASLGSMSPDIWKHKAVQRLYRRELKRFDMVSVREEDSKKYISEVYFGDVWCCMDPTLLLQAEDFEKLLSLQKHTQDYMYLYLLDQSEHMCGIVNEICRELDLPIVRCCDEMGNYSSVLEEAETDGPLEFLSRVKNASLVITNSFHGVCFSILFHKNFFYVKRVKQAYKTEELLKKLDLSDRCVPPEELKKVISKPIDYERVDRQLNDWREESLEFLRMALE